MNIEHVNDVCQIGKGVACCRYLTVAGGGFRCAKLDVQMRAAIDARVAGEAMKARGDNCAGQGGIAVLFRPQH